LIEKCKSPTVIRGPKNGAFNQQQGVKDARRFDQVHEAEA
jgi:hypothetical protein